MLGDMGKGALKGRNLEGKFKGKRRGGDCGKKWGERKDRRVVFCVRP